MKNEIKKIISLILICFFCAPRFANADEGPNSQTEKVKFLTEQIKSDSSLESRREASRDFFILAKNTDLSHISQQSVDEIIQLIDIPNIDDVVLYWVARSLGEIGPSAKSAISKLEEILPEKDCRNGSVTAADGIIMALIKLHGKFPALDPNCNRISL